MFRIYNRTKERNLTNVLWLGACHIMKSSHRFLYRERDAGVLGQLEFKTDEPQQHATSTNFCGFELSTANIPRLVSF